VRHSYKLIGYDPETDTFDPKKATAPHHTEVYTNLASTLGSQDKGELADRVMDQLIEVNPESAEAHLARGRYRYSLDDIESARTDVEKAFQLKPEDPNVLLFMSELAATDKDYEKATEYLATGKKLHPKDVRFYQVAASQQMRQEKYDKAIAELDQGIKSVTGNSAVQLLAFKAELQIPTKDLKGARETINRLERIPNIRPEFIEYYEARVMLEEGKWFPAVEALNKLRPKLAEMGFGRQMEIDYSIGLCYEKLGQPDLAIEAYSLVLDQDPENEPAKLGLVRTRAQKGLEPTDSKEDPWQEFIAIELKKPKEERNWQAIDDSLQKMAEEQKWDKANLNIRRAQLMTMREDYENARKLLKEADESTPDNLLIHRMLIQLARLDPKVGPEKALQTWEAVAKKFKDPQDQPELRLDKADILIALRAGQPNSDELKVELASLLAGIDDWQDAQKAELWGGMAARFLSLGLADEARQYLTLTAEVQPNDLPLRLSLFALALDAHDDAGMKEAQDKILEIVGDQNDSNWMYTEARRKLSLVHRGQLEPKALEEVRQLVNRSLEQRPGWHELHVLNAELELTAGNALKALEHYDRAQQLGRPYPAAVAQHIKLLTLAGRFHDAGRLLERIGESSRVTLLGQLYPEILFRTNRVNEALKQARAAIENNPDSAQNHYWYGQLLARSSNIPQTELDPAKSAASGAEQPTTPNQLNKEVMAQAIEEMRKAVKLQPEFPEAWFALISYYGVQNELDQAQAVLREAQLVLSGDNLQIFMARCYEALGRWFDAETMYRAVYEMAPDDLARAQQLAAFYLGNAYRQPDAQQKATPLINQILRAAAEGKIPANDPNLFWARRRAAHMLAATGDYQNLLKAEKLLASNSQDGALTIEDKLAIADILAGRPEPLKRRQAMGLLEEVSAVQPLGEGAEIVLGELYFAALGDWRKYSSQMEKAIARFQNSVQARAAYVRRLLNRSDQRSLEKAVTHVTKLRQLAPRSILTFELTTRLAAKLGKQEAARKQLLEAVPSLEGVQQLSDRDVQMLSVLANLLVELKDLDSAERIYREMAARDARQVPALATFLGLHRDVEQCFAKLNEFYSTDRVAALLQVAMTVVRQRRDVIGEKFDPEIQRWLDAGLRENPDSINLLIIEADLRDLQKRYDDAANIYRKLLDRSELTGIRRAVVLNNLSFLVALAGSDAAADVDPLKLVNEAAQIMGPNSDILDTRAVVLTSLGRYSQAIQDLELSVTDNPTASKYFHKADAHLRAGENKNAVEAWEKAEALNLGRDALNRMEFDRYAEMKGKIDQIRNASVTQADGLRRAG
jgi:tetratricopeptide (TPR) repeat protein